MIFLMIFFILVCLMLIFMVIVTPSQDGGLASAFGGMGSDSFFGTQASRHINRFMVFLAVTFLLVAMVINYINMGAHADEGGSFDPNPVPGATEPAPGPDNK